MNIIYTTKFQSRTAALWGARQNLEHMILLFWWDNIPQEIRAMRQPWIDDTKVAIEDYLDDHPTPTLLEISNLAVSLVETSVQILKDNA